MNEDLQAVDAETTAPELEAAPIAVANPILEEIKGPVLQDKLARAILMHTGGTLNVGDISTAATGLAGALMQLASNAPEASRVAKKNEYTYNSEMIAQVRENAVTLRGALEAIIYQLNVDATIEG